MNIANDAPHLMTFSRAFPYIERLTFKPGSHPSTLLQDINRILGIVSAHDGLLWPELHSIALSTPREHLDVPRLKSTILKLQAAGHPIRKLVLPQEVHPAMAEMGGTVELEDFYVDWPTPFDW
ncbi:hypothetical protein FIBSPDRAFT_927262 [Athelia psychrophila]|uniref:Uncharacterized protein n=1 Tax=Athelia psychrophila TaxID=1759441 RepID=A0A166RZG5_9AGAM|nr:hypothetical protein FIBSPDRAFT_927262 [Fibularhizoctonia sp. CBS 109695]